MKKTRKMRVVDLVWTEEKKEGGEWEITSFEKAKKAKKEKETLILCKVLYKPDPTARKKRKIALIVHDFVNGTITISPLSQGTKKGVGVAWEGIKAFIERPFNKKESEKSTIVFDEGYLVKVYDSLKGKYVLTKPRKKKRKKRAGA